MAISVIITFLIALLAISVVPGWEFGGHFFPYTFLIALLLAWGTEVNVLLAGVFFATLFEVFLGFHLGVLPLAFLTMVVAYAFLQGPIDLKPVVKEGWTFARAGLALVIGLLLWILGLAVSWSVLELVYSIHYPFSVILDLFTRASFPIEAFSEIALFLTLMALMYRRRKNIAY